MYTRKRSKGGNWTKGQILDKHYESNMSQSRYNPSGAKSEYSEMTENKRPCYGEDESMIDNQSQANLGKDFRFNSIIFS